LDPATGTATFLYFVIDQIHRKFAKQAGAWDDYVADHLLDRVFGFELLMAPYAVAHLKLGMQLQETGYHFESDDRLGIYLTNTLEEAENRAENLFASWFAEEANAASEIKRDKAILVVLGNPPYSGHSANRSEAEVFIPAGKDYVVRSGKDIVTKTVTRKPGAMVTIKTFIGNLIEDYKLIDGELLGEKNSKWLQDDYVKFIRFSQWRIDKTGEGIVGFITNHGYLDNPTFRGMRQQLMRTFTEIYILDLHGSSKKKEKTPDGGKDENVFDIQQGVAILLAVKTKRSADDTASVATVRHAELWGEREVRKGGHVCGGKYHWLWEHSAETTPWQELAPTSPFYLFAPQNVEVRAEYEQGESVKDGMPMNVLGFQTHRDDFAVAFDMETIRERIAEFRGTVLSDNEVRDKYKLVDNRDWKMAESRSGCNRRCALPHTAQLAYSEA
jgi:predicted helicase